MKKKIVYNFVSFIATTLLAIAGLSLIVAVGSLFPGAIGISIAFAALSVFTGYAGIKVIYWSEDYKYSN
ncbi:hypothetical protein [Escherichia phage UPEC06]|nr:hypothetical protein [Escherichia phage UPEC06]